MGTITVICIFVGIGIFFYSQIPPPPGSPDIVNIHNQTTNLNTDNGVTPLLTPQELIEFNVINKWDSRNPEVFDKFNMSSEDLYITLGRIYYYSRKTWDVISESPLTAEIIMFIQYCHNSTAHLILFCIIWLPKKNTC